MRKPVQFLRPRNVNGPLYQTGEIAGFAPDLADALIADGSAKEPDAISIEVGHGAPAGTVHITDPDIIGTASGFPFKNSDERQAARKGKR